MGSTSPACAVRGPAGASRRRTCSDSSNPAARRPPLCHQRPRRRPPKHSLRSNPLRTPRRRLAPRKPSRSPGCARRSRATWSLRCRPPRGLGTSPRSTWRPSCARARPRRTPSANARASTSPTCPSSRAVIEALLAFPTVNSELREDQLILKHYVNLGIAVALEEGLIVPVVKGADTMNIVGLARAINDVATRARTKHLVPDDVQGGTFTITNPGPFGSIISVPIINPPQCAILAFDAVEKRPVVIDDAIAVRHMVYISMSWDHRIIDGATAAKFLARVKQNLETWDFGPEVGVPARGS